MKLFLIAILVVSLHQILVNSCALVICDRQTCDEVSSCPPGSYKKPRSPCTCCRVCVKYQTEGQSCRDRECLPGELVCNENKICESGNRSKFCASAFCVNAKNCTGGEILLPADINKCRCCDFCASPNESKDPRCKDGYYTK